MDPINSSSTKYSELLQKLAAELQRDFAFKVYHLCTHQTRVPSLYSKPPGQEPLDTSCLKHFFAVSINPPPNAEKSEQKEILCYAVEIFIYFTAHNTTFFVSKADSTGYLDLLKLEKNISSPLRTITTTFLHHLTNTYQEPKVHSIISLFARSQNQYLFPRSIEYPGKHVLNDRSLIRWWCSVLNPIVEDARATVNSHWETVKGYLIIPGLDSHETIMHVPKRSEKLWTVGHPLLEISTDKENIVPKFLIPQFPDDPKARFIDELDEETLKCGNLAGHWKNITTLDQFWEMMAFRQECSAGRLVGFIWVVFSPKNNTLSCDSNCSVRAEASLLEKNLLKVDTIDQHELSHRISQPLPNPHMTKTIPFHLHTENTKAEPDLHNSLKLPKRSCKKRKLTGKIIPRRPKFKNKLAKPMQSHVDRRASSTNGIQASGQIVVDEAIYNRLMDFLLSLDFSRLDRAASSSKRWIEEVRCAGWGKMKESWGQSVTGSKVTPVRENSTNVGLSMLNSSLVRKKPKITPSIQTSCAENKE